VTGIDGASSRRVRKNRAARGLDTRTGAESRRSDASAACRQAALPDAAALIAASSPRLSGADDAPEVQRSSTAAGSPPRCS
jgi:hypothetical protein